MNHLWHNGNHLQLVKDGRIKRRGAIVFWKKYDVQLYDVRFGTRRPFIEDPSGFRWTVEEFDGSDLGSIPMDLQWLAGDNAAYPLAFAFHDFAVRNGYLVDYDTGEKVYISRKRADRMLYHWVRAEGGSKWTAKKIKAGASLGTRFKWASRRYSE